MCVTAQNIFILANYFDFDIMENELFATIVGSHMWKMQRPDSDLDIFTCYVGPTRDLLIGRQFKSVSTPLPDDNLDMTEHEIGKVVNMLIKGNINFVWGLTSPEIETTTPYHEDLIKIFKQELSKNVYHSIDGLFRNNYKKYVSKVKKIQPKRIWMMYRTLKFGIALLETGELNYKAVDTTISLKDLNETHLELANAFENSTLKTEPKTEAYYDFLYKVRVLVLTDAL